MAFRVPAMGRLHLGTHFVIASLLEAMAPVLEQYLKLKLQFRF